MTLSKVYGEEVNDTGVSKNQLLGTITLAYLVQKDHWEAFFFTPLAIQEKQQLFTFLKTH